MFWRCGCVTGGWFAKWGMLAMRRSGFLSLLFSVGLAGAVGCDSAALVGAAGSSDDDGTTPGGDAEARAALSPEEARALAVAAVAAVWRAVVAIEPVSDLQAIYEAGMPPPSCPRLTARVEGGNLDVTLDYGSGCGPATWKDSVVAGKVTGTYFAAFNAFDLALSAMAVDGAPVEGTAAGSLTASGEWTTFVLTVNVSDGAGMVRGTATVELEAQTSKLVITDGAATVSDEGSGSYRAEFDGVIVEALTSAGIGPVDGSVVLTPVGSGETTDSNSLTVSF